jgi:hypothetical protein
VLRTGRKGLAAGDGTLERVADERRGGARPDRGRYAVLFPLDANDRQILFVTGGRVTAYIRSVLIWLVTYFIKFERTLPGVQTWLGRHRVSQAEADDAMKKAQSHRM